MAYEEYQNMTPYHRAEVQTQISSALKLIKFTSQLYDIPIQYEVQGKNVKLLVGQKEYILSWVELYAFSVGFEAAMEAKNI